VSGFVATVQEDGASVDGSLLRRLTESMAYCGPDHRGTWVEGAIGLGHALLGYEPPPTADEHQPARLGERLAIVADARLDGRAELVARLRKRRQEISSDTPDARLILHAYDEWGEGCLEHLIGDFAFALWDGRARRLFGARDHFGVIPFYYADVRGGVVLGNVLRAVRGHPSVSATSNDRAIGDFLLFGMNMDVTTSAFKAIQSLPPGHALTIDERGARVRRYWEPPPAQTVRLGGPNEYVERFTELFDQAVADRLRSDRVGTQLSGGMDSTSIAATAHAVLTSRGDSFDLRAYTISYAGLAPDEEPGYAAQIAERLRIPLEPLTLLDYMKRHPDDLWSFPEPVGIASQSADYEVLRQVSTFGRALFTGLGGDPLFQSSPAWPRGIADWRDRISYAGRAVAAGRAPRLGLRSALRRRPKPGWADEPPDLKWVDRSFATRVDLAGRWRELAVQPGEPSAYGTTSFGDLMHPLWPGYFAASHPSTQGTTVRLLFPFFDLRLVGFVRALPAHPWLQDKRLLREAMRARLPESVLRRPKRAMFPATADVSADPRRRLAMLAETREWRRRLLAAPGICEYVDVEEALQLVDSPVAGTTSFCFANCFSLAHWLQVEHEAGGRRINGEETHDVAGLDA
jgi:asparagine synthase (glutamine-hydrolysing)